jgi:predicted dehydrogenase
VHRIAARLNDASELMAGAQSSDTERDRSYADLRDMAAREATLPEGIDTVVILTPNPLHFPAAEAFLHAGIPVIGGSRRQPRWTRHAPWPRWHGKRVHFSG